MQVRNRFVIRLLNHPEHKDYWFSSWLFKDQATSLNDHETIHIANHYHSREHAEEEIRNLKECIDRATMFYEGIDGIVEQVIVDISAGTITPVK